MGGTLDYAKRMLPLPEPFRLRWLEEAVIPDDIHGYAELKAYGRVPIACGEHEFAIYGFRELLEAHAVDFIQFDTNPSQGCRADWGGRNDHSQLGGHQIRPVIRYIPAILRFRAAEALSKIAVYGASPGVSSVPSFPAG